MGNLAEKYKDNCQAKESYGEQPYATTGRETYHVDM